MRSSYTVWRYSSSKPKFFSHLFRPVEAVPKEKITTPTLCKSLKLMLKNGLIVPSSTGIFSLMPLTIMSLEKLCTLIDNLMKDIGGQKVLLPTLIQSSLWKTSGRWNNENAHLFKLKDRHQTDYCLGPTHEEAVTDLVSDSSLSLKSLPLKLYQISTKFRDEINPRLGLLRGREFLMKDMYSFDRTEETAQKTYEEVCGAYDKLFSILGIDHVKVLGSNAGMGGSHSHEYHFLSDVGEDEILYCPNCKTGMNTELISDGDDSTTNCTKCNSQLQKSNGFEVGHAFLLGTAYSKPFEAIFKSEDGISKILQMGCYGLGVTRILAASIECLSEAERIRWPHVLPPFYVSLIPPKKGSKEQDANSFVSYLWNTLSKISFLSDAVVIDDRTHLSIGRRVQDANAIGVPYVVIAGSSVLQSVPRIEVIENYCNGRHFLTHSEVMEFFRNLSRSYDISCMCGDVLFNNTIKN